MSTAARKDVQLIVRARTEGERLIESMAGALEVLFGAQEHVGTGAARTQGKMAQLGAAVVALEGAYGKLDQAANRGGDAFARQQATLAKTATELASVRAQIENAKKAIASAQTGVVDTKLAGGDTAPQIARIKAAEAALAALQSQEVRLTGSIHAQEAALGGSRNELQRLGSTANAVEAALIGVGNSAERAALKTAAATESATAKYRGEAIAVRELVDLEARLGVSRAPATSSGATVSALDEQARAMEAVGLAAREAGQAQAQMARRADEIRGIIDPVAHLTERHNRALKESRDLMRAGALSAAEFSAREKQLAIDLKNATDQLGRQGRGEHGRPSLFGLKPYELTNLGYQVNDVFTQLASGTSLTQTLAQQGGQLLQLFPKLGSAIIAALGNPLIVAAASAFGLIVMAVVRMRTEMERTRQFEGVLRSMGDGAQYNARALADAADQLDRYGMSGEAAMASIRSFLAQGVAPERIVQFGRAAQDMADVLLVDVADASRQVSAGLTGNWEAMKRLQEATHFLNGEEEARVRTLFEEGRASEARSAAARVFTQRMNEAAQQARGPWTDAGRRFGAAWTGVLDKIGDSNPVILAAVAGLDGLAGVLERISGLAERMPSLDSMVGQIADQERLVALGEERLRAAQVLEARVPSLSPRTEGIRAQLDAARAELARLRANLMDQGRGAPLSGNTVTQTEEQRRRAAAVRDINFQHEIADLQRQAQEAARDADRIRLQGEIEYRLALKETNDRQIAALRRRNAEERERGRSSQQNDQEILGVARRYIGRDERVAGDRGVLQELFRAANVSIDPRITAWCAAFVNAVLATQGIRGTGRLNARSFQNFGEETATPRAGDIVVFRDLQPGRGGRRDPSQGHVGFLTGFDRDGNPRVIGGNQGGSRAVTEQTFNRRDVLSYRRAPASGGIDPVTLDDRRAQAQAELNNQLDLDIAARRRAADQAVRLLGLSGEQLLSEERRQAVEDAVHQAQLNAVQRGLEFDAARKAALEEIVGREFDIAHAQARATEAVDEASAERAAVLERLQAAQERGDTALVVTLTENLRGLDEQLRQAIQSGIAFWRTMGNTPEARTAIHGLENLREGLARTTEEMRRAPLDQQSERLQSIRGGLQEQIQFFRDQGQMGIADQLRGQLRELDVEIVRTIDRLIALWSTSTDPDAQATILQFQNLRNHIVLAHDEFRIAAGDIQRAFAGDLTNAVTQWAQAVGEGGNVLRATRDAAMSFASDFLRSLAQMLLQAWALKLAMKIGFARVADGANSLFNAAPLIAAGGTLNAAGLNLNVAGGTLTAAGGVWAAVAAQIMLSAQMLMAANATGGGGLAGVFHGGGIAGQATRTRSVWPGIFANAQRFHGGGFAGLRSGEIPAILERGEEILGRSNPRHVLNGGGGGGDGEPRVDLKSVVVFDPSDVLAKGLSDRVGQRVLLTFVRKNAGAFNAALR